MSLLYSTINLIMTGKFPALWQCRYKAIVNELVGFDRNGCLAFQGWVSIAEHLALKEMTNHVVP